MATLEETLQNTLYQIGNIGGGGGGRPVGNPIPQQVVGPSNAYTAVRNVQPTFGGPSMSRATGTVAGNSQHPMYDLRSAAPKATPPPRKKVFLIVILLILFVIIAGAVVYMIIRKAQNKRVLEEKRRQQSILSDMETKRRLEEEAAEEEASRAYRAAQEERAREIAVEKQARAAALAQQHKERAAKEMKDSLTASLTTRQQISVAAPTSSRVVEEIDDDIMQGVSVIRNGIRMATQGPNVLNEVCDVETGECALPEA
jgi:hypothetical protein